MITLTRSQLIRHFDTPPTAPAYHGKNVTAILRHPHLKNGKIEVEAWNEREARRQAWRYAITENLAGFHIDVKYANRRMMP